MNGEQDASSVDDGLARRFGRNRSGGIAVVMSLAIVPLLGCVALAVDVSTWYAAKTELQKIADGAAIASARELRVGFASPAQVEAAAQAYALAALQHGAKMARDARIVARVSENRDAVMVSVESGLTPVFSRLVYDGLTTVEVSSTARLSGSAPICMIGTKPNGRGVLQMEDDAYLDAGGCGIYSNSTHPQSLILSDSSRVLANLVCSSGGVRQDGGRSNPPAQTDCPSVGDPLEPRLEAVKATFGDPCGGQSTKLVITSNWTLQPGNYCGGIEVRNGARLTLESGNYVIGRDGLEVKGNARLIGQYVSMLFVRDAELDLGEDTTVRLSATKDGVLAGILFMQYPTGGNDDREFKISSNNARELLGTIYIPKGVFKVDAESPVAGESAYTVIVANKIEISDKARLTLNIDYAATDVPVPEGIGPKSPVHIAY
ncbi:MAG: pilus assembly protein [Microvirga sp.]|nr:pilus assembly protein [Microvirga sp.]